MNRRSMTACFLLLLCFAGCKKREVPKPAAVLSPPTQRLPRNLPRTEGSKFQAAGPPVNLDAARAVLTEDKLSRFATYQKEMLSVTSGSPGFGLHPSVQGGMDQDKLHGAMPADDRMAKFTAVRQAALEKSGLTQNETATLKQVATHYYTRSYALSGQAAQLETLRKEFAAQYGPEALALIQKHEPEFFAINQKRMGTAIGPMIRKQ